jgi:hypothetical protein
MLCKPNVVVESGQINAKHPCSTPFCCSKSLASAISSRVGFRGCSRREFHGSLKLPRKQSMNVTPRHPIIVREYQLGR